MYAIIKKDSIKGGGRYAHIFEVTKNGDGGFSIVKRSFCGDKLATASSHHHALGSEGEVRSAAAKLRNLGVEVCPNCVAELYK